MSRLLSANGMIAWVAVRLPKVLLGYRILQMTEDGAAYMRDDGLSVIMSGNLEQDGKRWLHVSLARADRLPSWEDVRSVKDAFLGKDTYAVQVFPPERFYVNLNPHCLHMFSCVDGHPLPEFSRGSGSL